MARSIDSLLSDKTKLEQFKRNAYEHAKIFDKSQVIPQYIAIYEKVISGKYTWD